MDGFSSRNRKTREERARQRHSVEILSTNAQSSAASFSSVLPVALEESLIAERLEPIPTAPGSSVVQPPANFNDSYKSCLTPTLSLLVDLWEKLGEPIGSQ